MESHGCPAPSGSAKSQDIPSCILVFSPFPFSTKPAENEQVVWAGPNVVRQAGDKSGTTPHFTCASVANVHFVPKCVRATPPWRRVKLGSDRCRASRGLWELFAIDIRRLPWCVRGPMKHSSPLLAWNIKTQARYRVYIGRRTRAGGIKKNPGNGVCSTMRLVEMCVFSRARPGRGHEIQPEPGMGRQPAGM